uniref:Uncharacterized protein n=1 Tax=Anguilla anguilla TaxID=7936 RepID=A0A0E9VWV9_ANGAN
MPAFSVLPDQTDSGLILITHQYASLIT